MVGAARHRWCLDVDILEVLQASDPYLGTIDTRRVVPRVFELANFAPDHLVARARIAADVDLADIDASARIDIESERGRAVLAVDLGDRKCTRLNSSHANISY